MVNLIWFTDEKLFTIAIPKNSQNDRVYAAAGTRKKDISANRLLRTRSTFNRSVMVSVGVSVICCRRNCYLIFVNIQTISHFNKMALLLTELARLLNCRKRRLLISYLLIFDR